MTPLARFFEFADARRAAGDEFPVPEGWFRNGSKCPWVRHIVNRGQDRNDPTSPVLITGVDTATALDYRAACDCVVEWMCRNGNPVSVYLDSGKVWGVTWYNQRRRFAADFDKLTALLDAAGEVVG